MEKPQPSLTPISLLMRFGELRPTERSGGKNRKSYPIPLPGPEGLLVGFLHYETPEHEGSWFVSAPSHLSFWNAESGELAELRAFSPAELGLPVPAEWLGRYPAPDERQTPEFASKEDQILRCYDVLLAPFAANLTQVSDEARSAARDFRSLSPALWESPLIPYYQRLGQRFLGWVGNVSS